MSLISHHMMRRSYVRVLPIFHFRNYCSLASELDVDFCLCTHKLNYSRMWNMQGWIIAAAELFLFHQLRKNLIVKQVRGSMSDVGKIIVGVNFSNHFD